ncbi:MAG: FixH family protein [Azoarcus sp.]|jgi:hypothetical protein|nr:FixH family protein [Azoarcus sp.]
MAADLQIEVVEPWYRNGWPWFLFGVPAVSVVVGISLYIIANYWNVDSLVAGDYSKDGRGVAVLIDKQKTAESLGLSAQATVSGTQVSVKLGALHEKDLPPTLRLAIVHPTQDRFDQQVLLQKGEADVYSGQVMPLHDSRWQFQLEDESRTWRMLGNANIPTETVVSIKPFQPGRISQAESQ